MKNIDGLDLKEQILEQIPTPLMAVDRNFKILYINNETRKLLGIGDRDVLGMNCSKLLNSRHCEENCCMRQAMNDLEACSNRLQVNIGNKNMTVDCFAVPLKDENDELIGGLELIMDVTDQFKYEQRLKEQSQTIREMSTPTIRLWDGVLVLPVVGVVDSVRAQYMMESILDKIVETYSQVIILDIQGVAAVDTAVANHLIKITNATKLMGCQCIMSGISPAVAQTIIHLGIDMRDICTKATLSDALEEAFLILDMKVVSNKE